MKLKRRIGYFFNSSLLEINVIGGFELELIRFNKDENKPENCRAVECVVETGTKKIVAVKCEHSEKNIRYHPVLEGSVRWEQYMENVSGNNIEKSDVARFLTACYE